MSEYAVDDMLTVITNALQANTRFKELVGNRLKGYVYPESKTKTPLFVVVAPMDPASTEFAGSDVPLGQHFAYQINVEGLNRHSVKEVAAIVSKTMSGLNFAQSNVGLDKYFPDTNRFVDARRFFGGSKIYDNRY